MKVTFLMLCLAALAFSQETVESVRKQIKAVEEETRREVSLHEAEKKRHADFIEAGRQKVVALNSQTKALKAELDSMKAELSRLEDARSKAAAQVKRYEGKKAKYASDLAKMIRSFAPLIEADFPYRNEEAVASLTEIAEQLESGVIMPDDALGRAIELIADRIRLGYTTEVWNGSLSLGNRSVQGTYLRYGAASSVFISADGNEFFWLESGPEGYSWRNVSQDIEMRSLLKEAMKVAEGKTAPKLVLIPVSVPAKEEK